MDRIDPRMTQLFALVSEALAGATEALLGRDVAGGLRVVEGDQDIHELASEVELLVRELLEQPRNRSAAPPLRRPPHRVRARAQRDLAEHIAQRAAQPRRRDDALSRGICSGWPRSPSRRGGRRRTPTWIGPPMPSPSPRMTRRSISSTTAYRRDLLGEHAGSGGGTGHAPGPLLREDRRPRCEPGPADQDAPRRGVGVCPLSD